MPNRPGHPLGWVVQASRRTVNRFGHALLSRCDGSVSLVPVVQSLVTQGKYGPVSVGY